MMAHLNRRSALGLLAAGSSGVVVAATPAISVSAVSAVLLAEPDAMAVLCEARRRYLAAYALADFDDTPDGEDLWRTANDPDPGNSLGRNPPPITSDAGLRAAIDYVASDVDFAQADHVRVLTRALEYLDRRGI